MGNQAAHYLAKYALEYPNQIWIEEVPPMVIHCISAGLCFDIGQNFPLP